MRNYIQDNKIEQTIESQEMSFNQEKQKIIFIVDDDADDRMFCKMHMKQSKWVKEVESFSSAADLFDHFDQIGLYKDDIVDVEQSIVLLDVHMPAVNGMEALDYIRTHPITTDMTVVLLTSDVSADKVYEAYKLQATGFIQKPFSVRDFDDVLTRGTRQTKTIYS